MASITHTLVDSWSATRESELTEVFSSCDLFTLDLEGVNLSRIGKICLIQMSTRDHHYLFDLLGKDKHCDMVVWLKSILEGPALKIIHDCRMDSDALFHLLNIRLSNVHDTSVWHTILSGNERKPLNEVLLANHLKPNTLHDNSVYRQNFAFWEERPLSHQMIDRALGDIESLFKLYECQRKGVTSHQIAQAEVLSTKYLNARLMSFYPDLRPSRPGRFIGKEGKNVKALAKKSDTLIYQKRGPSRQGSFVVYYNDASGLRQVKDAAAE